MSKSSIKKILARYNNPYVYYVLKAPKGNYPDIRKSLTAYIFKEKRTNVIIANMRQLEGVSRGEYVNISNFGTKEIIDTVQFPDPIYKYAY